MERNTLPETGFLRVQQIIGDPKANPPIPAIIPVCSSTWWAGVRSGRFPAPTRGLGGRITVWRVEDIRALIERAFESDRSAPKSSPGCSSQERAKRGKRRVRNIRSQIAIESESNQSAEEDPPGSSRRESAT